MNGNSIEPVAGDHGMDDNNIVGDEESIEEPHQDIEKDENEEPTIGSFVSASNNLAPNTSSVIGASSSPKKDSVPHPATSPSEEPAAKKARQVSRRASRIGERVSPEVVELLNTSFLWFALQLLAGAQHYIEDTVNVPGKQALELVIAQLAVEKGFLQITFDVDTELPYHLDYRGLKSYFWSIFDIFTPHPRSFAQTSIGFLPTETPMLLLTGPKYIEISKITGGQIVKLASEWIKTGQNLVFDSDYVPTLPEKSNLVTRAEHEFYKQQGRPTGNYGINRMPVPIVEVDEGFDEAKLEKFVTSASICMVRGIGKAVKLVKELFDVKTIADASDPNAKIEVFRQVPESSDGNNKMLYKNRGGLLEDKSWELPNIQGFPLLSKFAQHFLDVEEATRKAQNRILENHGNHPQIFEDFKNDLLAKKLNIVTPGFFHPNTVLLAFGTNVDLDNKERFGAQMAELEKLPGFIRPTGMSNMLMLIDEPLPGIKTPQVYFKFPGAKTSAHLENQAIASININLGPGECIWYSIPFEFVGTLEKLLIARGLSLYKTRHWPNETELMEAGIPVSKFVQGPDDLVYVGVGTYHWVHSNGMAVNVSWNLMPASFNQISVAGILHDHNALREYRTIIPIVPLAWRIAEEGIHYDKEMFIVLKTILALSLAMSKMEEDLAIQKGYTMTPAKDYKGKIRSIERCSVKACKRNAILFNTMVFERKPICINCAARKDTPYKAYQRYSMDELTEIFNNYVYPEPVQLPV